MNFSPVVWITDSESGEPHTGSQLVTHEWLKTIEKTRGPPVVIRVRHEPSALRRIGLLMTGMPGLWSTTIGGWAGVARELSSARSSASPAVAVVDHFRLAWTLPLIRHRLACPAVLLAQNVESGARRSYLGRATRLEQAAAALELPALSLWERHMSRAFDVIVTLSQSDACHFEMAYGCRNVQTIPPSLETPTLRPPATRVQHAGSKRRTLLYVGSFDYGAKRANARWFLTKIAPFLIAQHPACEVVIVGRGSDRLRSHSWARAPWLRIEGEVADVRPYYDKALAAIVPENVGGGFKTKVLEAIWNQVPVIGTSACLAPLSLRPGRDYLPADTPEEWSAATGLLIDDTRAAAKMAVSAANEARRLYCRSGLETRITSLLSGLAVAG